MKTTPMMARYPRNNISKMTPAKPVSKIPPLPAGGKNTFPRSPNKPKITPQPKPTVKPKYPRNKPRYAPAPKYDIKKDPHPYENA